MSHITKKNGPGPYLGSEATPDLLRMLASYQRFEADMRAPHVGCPDDHCRTQQRCTAADCVSTWTGPQRVTGGCSVAGRVQ